MEKIGTTVLFQLKPGLTLHGVVDGVQGCRLEDTARGKFYRLGGVESLIVQALMINSSLTDAVQQVVDRQLLEREQAMRRMQLLISWLQARQLTQNDGDVPRKGFGLRDVAASVFYRRFSLGKQAHVLAICQSYFGWFAEPWVIKTVSTLLVVLLVASASQLPKFVESVTCIYATNQWMWLGLAWIALKVFHELGHAVVCRKYGGEIRDVGIALIVFVPLAYVDVSSCWRLASKWQRLHVAVAGCLAELPCCIAALAIWLFSSDLETKSWAANIVCLTLGSALLFNLNPLLRFDGYFVLSDVFEIDNLHALSQQYVRYLIWRYLLGFPVPQVRLPRRAFYWVHFYALASYVYRFTVCAGLVLAAQALFAGAGIALALLGIVSFFVIPVWQVLAQLSQYWQRGELQISRLVLRCGLIAAVVLLLLMVTPAGWPVCPGVVEYDPPILLRAPADGIVRQIHVENGQDVQAGDLILKLENPELEVELLSTKMELALVQINIEQARWIRDANKLSELELELLALKQKFEILNHRCRELDIRAPTAGRIIARGLTGLSGVFIREGTEIAQIGNEEAKRIRLSLEQSDTGYAQFCVGQQVSVLVSGYGRLEATVDHLETLASRIVSDKSLLAPYGGMLSAVSSGDDNQPFRYTSPRLTAFLKLPEEQARSLRAGQRVAITSAQGRASIASELFDAGQSAMSNLLYNRPQSM